MSDVRAVLEQLGYKLIEYPREFRALPLYRESKNQTSLRISKKDGFWVDFAIDKCGKLEELVKITLNLNDVSQAREWLSGKIDYQVESKPDRPTLEEPITIPVESIATLVKDNSYWNKRGISNETVNHFRGGLSLRGKMMYRYVFPIFETEKKIIGAAGRSISDEYSPKWKLLGKVGDWAYPLFFNRQDIIKNGSVILVESIGDMLSLWQNQIRNTFVLFGVRISGKQICELIKLNVKIIIATNNDSNKENNVGSLAAHKIYNKLVNFFDVKQIKISLPNKKDFGEMNKEEVKIWYEQTNINICV
jgi:hypothetical protein